MRISEGLREGDLKDLLIPLLSIDEYESKIADDDSIIVVGFFVDDKDPAMEFSKFVDRTVETILDTDVSPAPTDSGYYMVFLEVARDDKFFKTMSGILNEIENITGIQDNTWTFKAYKAEDIYDFNKENVSQYVRIHEPTTESFDIATFFDKSFIDNIQIFENHVKLGDQIYRVTKMKTNGLMETGSIKDAAISRRLDSLLGMNYSSTVNQGQIQIFNNLTHKSINIMLDTAV